MHLGPKARPHDSSWLNLQTKVLVFSSVYYVAYIRQQLYVEMALEPLLERICVFVLVIHIPL